eukprot:CAMPEP_0196789632 /NCGR_PEP_ID=MMETSP1104-20130614/26885_1 /TAXON_ID=33652 /ORGANISM="Cafeteria sp., Strain Caron Lab Isolate" /LENGTH=46 /DNA_ID= /DNA_START= /DNA_END= /DNA_ORIENTATION=
MGAGLVEEALLDLPSALAQATPQNEALATHAPKLRAKVRVAHAPNR